MILGKGENISQACGFFKKKNVLKTPPSRMTKLVLSGESLPPLGRSDIQDGVRVVWVFLYVRGACAQGLCTGCVIISQPITPCAGGGLTLLQLPAQGN